MSLAHLPLEDLSVESGTRPKAPALPGATEAHRSKGRHLAAIHRGYLADLARIAAVLERIEAGDSPPEHLRDIVLTLDMAQNLRAFGSLCGQGCQILTMHHNIEQAHMFPALERAGVDGITAVVARLRQEHEVVHELLKRLEQASHALVASPQDAELAQCRAVFLALKSAIASHFHYEETELEEALGLFVDAI